MEQEWNTHRRGNVKSLSTQSARALAVIPPALRYEGTEVRSKRPDLLVGTAIRPTKDLLSPSLLRCVARVASSRSTSGQLWKVRIRKRELPACAESRRILMKKEQKSSLLVILMVVLSIGGWAWHKGKQESKQERAATPTHTLSFQRASSKWLQRAIGTKHKRMPLRISTHTIPNSSLVKRRGVHVISCDG
jgi:hypothetical protein